MKDKIKKYIYYQFNLKQSTSPLKHPLFVAAPPSLCLLYISAAGWAADIVANFTCKPFFNNGIKCSSVLDKLQVNSVKVCHQKKFSKSSLTSVCKMWSSSRPGWESGTETLRTNTGSHFKIIILTWSSADWPLAFMSFLKIFYLKSETLKILTRKALL